MILFRFISKEILTSFFAVALTLLLIVVSNSLARYLSRAAAGLYDADVLIWIILYRIPASLEIILPLSLFLGVMLVVGRMYMESEATILFATGTSQKQFTWWVMVPALFVTFLVGVVSFDLGPRGLREANVILAEQSARSEIDRLAPGRFLNISGRENVVYSEAVEEGELSRVFLASLNRHGTPFVMTAPVANEVRMDGRRYVVFRDGQRYDFSPGTSGGQIISFESHGILIPDREVEEEIGKLKTWSTVDLIRAGGVEHIATLHYRLSIVLMVPIMTLLAMSLGRTNPRSGKYAKLVPGILLFLVYLVLISASQSAIEDEKIPTWLGMWWIHLCFLALGWWLLISPEREMKRVARAQA